MNITQLPGGAGGRGEQEGIDCHVNLLAHMKFHCIIIWHLKYN